MVPLALFTGVRHLVSTSVWLRSTVLVGREQSVMVKGPSVCIQEAACMHLYTPVYFLLLDQHKPAFSKPPQTAPTAAN